MLQEIGARNTCKRRSRWQQEQQQQEQQEQLAVEVEEPLFHCDRCVRKRKQNAKRKPLTKPQNATDIFSQQQQKE
ncbi:hypothetical protein AWZ03_014205 [Drosophila navojoa]|uniref:Uncharacterized protein n=1 Tax=Drosophila navojoa TaxID=7232 RepID=A0A484ATI3_DRONA|nr:hypothetical protein AWZ03_014205 [Drosophila navojoa]